MKYIKSVGVELEGAIPRSAYEIIGKWLTDNKLISHYDIGNDASVNVIQGDYEYYSNYDDGMELKFWDYDINKVLEFVKLCFNNGFIQNRTCGNHIHLRFVNDNICISVFSYPKIQKMFFEEYKKFSESRKNKEKYLSRLNSNFCLARIQKANVGFLDLHNFCFSSNRYRAINLNSYLERQKTLEIRILPYAESFKEYKEMFLWLLEVVEKLLDKALKHTTISLKPRELNPISITLKKSFEIKKYVW